MSRDQTLRRRSFLKATGGAAAVAAFAGCSGDGDGGDGGSDGEDGTDGEDGSTPTEAEDGGDGGDGGSDNELNLINSTITSLDPIQSTDTASSRIIVQVYEGLTHYTNGTTEIENILAEDYEISDDLTTLTFTLKDAQFHNGDQVTAQDFVYSLRRLAESENSERANFLLGHEFLAVTHERDDEDAVVPDTLGVEAVDDQTLEINVEVPNANALELLAYDAFSAVPEGVVGDIEGYDGEVSHDEFSSETMIGSGPFEFDTWEPDAEARVTAFGDYHGDAPNVDAVHWQVIEDDDAAYTYAMERSADMFGDPSGMPTAQYDPDKIDADEDDQGRRIGTYGPLENGDEVEYVGVPQLSTYYVAFNAPQVPRPVRQAISYVTNREELLIEVFKERGQEAWTFTPPGIWPGGQSAYEEFIQDYPYGRNETDRESARQVLEEAGFTQDDPFQMTLTTYESNVFQEFGRLTRDKLSGLGVELELEQAPFATLIERGQNGDLEFYSLGWTWSWPEADYGHFGFEPENTDTSRMPEETNGYYLDWDDVDSEAAQQAQEAWEQVENNPHPEEGEEARNEAYLQIEEAVWDDAVMIPLLHGMDERFIYNHVDMEPFGAMGPYLQRWNNVTLNE